MLRKLNQPFYEEDPGKGNGGAGAAAEEVRAQVRKELEQEYAGLKANRDAVLEEKRQLKEKLAGIESVIATVGGQDGIKALQELKGRLEKDEMGKLLAEGKYEEVLERRTARMRSEHDQQVKSLTDQLEVEHKHRLASEQARVDLMLETSVRAAAGKMGVIDSAVSDVILRAKGVFSFDQERGSLVIKDEQGGAVLGKDGKTPMPIEEWLEGHKESARHWFPPSKGAGAQGGRGGDAGQPDLSKMSLSEYAKWREENGLTKARGIPG